ncbi:glucosamine-6-phosphate deaminase [Tichowtungia aerotolerans]|uniref:Glucosamine-6-phosphate deaminase n=1 Tax=Tichowtungia aerotolerans TaxID=2697043 RepID=A0A6P1M4X8_9BACT|nr:glucosamine-6-phosphate deaminase [Tichowtungia aerotolerans]QHI69112.1 glucosamine-6-phosphate deaminase [Tichowtungia aerotolerans]
MELIIKDNGQVASEAAARVVARLVHEKPNAVIGLATGSTPLMLYRELIRLHKEEGLDFSQVTTFNLDEYIGLLPEHEQSYRRFMNENLFEHINIKMENTHVPDGMAEDVPASCAAYEQAIVDAGGIDLQVLGIGSDGHVGFNEPTSSFASRTRIKTLTRQTVADNARFFENDESRVPHHCITMGIGTIMDARMNIMLAFGENKAEAVAATVEGPVASIMPASILQHHANAKVFIDEAAASQLKLADYYRWVYDNKPDWQKDA